MYSVLVKELWNVQLQRGAVGFDPSGAKMMVAQFAPSFPRDVLDAVRSWIPIVSEVSPASLLPDIDHYPPLVKEVYGFSITQRKLLLEAVEIILDSFTEHPEGLGNGSDAVNPHLLTIPRTSIACISAQICSMLEHVDLLRTPDAEVQPAADVDQRMCSRAPIHPGSKQELTEELQQCRQYAFDVEKELMTQAKIAELSMGREKKEHEKAMARVLQINNHLEDKLRHRTEEHQKATHRILTYEQRLQHDQWLLGEKEGKIRELEHQLHESECMQEDILLPEREYGKRVIRLRLQEFEGICRNNERLKNVQLCMDGRTDVLKDALKNVPTSRDLAELALKTLNELEDEFEISFQNRAQRVEEFINSQKKYTHDQEIQASPMYDQSGYFVCVETQTDLDEEGQNDSTPRASFNYSPTFFQAERPPPVRRRTLGSGRLMELHSTVIEPHRHPTTPEIQTPRTRKNNNDNGVYVGLPMIKRRSRHTAAHTLENLDIGCSKMTQSSGVNSPGGNTFAKDDIFSTR